MNRLNSMRQNSRSLVFNAQHLGDIGTMEVQIEQSNVFTMVCKSKREIYRNSGFSHAAFSAQHEDDVFRINLRFGRQSFGSTLGSILWLS